MPLGTDVLSALAVDVKPRKKGEGPPKRYIAFLLDEWHEKVDKPMGRGVSAEEAKQMFCNLLAKLNTGEWELNTSPTKK